MRRNPRPKEDGQDTIFVSSSGAESHSSVLAPGSRWNPFKSYLRFRRKRILTVEPVMFLYMFGLFLYVFVIGQFVFNTFGREKYVKYDNFTGSFNFCITTAGLDDLKNDTGKKVEEESSAFNLAFGVTGQLPSIFAALLYGPLSDRTGRRLIIHIIAFVACVTGIVSILIIHFEGSLYYLIGLSVFTALGGSLTGMFTVLFSYIADIASNKRLILRLGILEAMIYLGGVLSLSSTGIWLRKSGCNFIQPLLLYVACNAGIIVYTLLYLPESLPHSERNQRKEGQYKGLQMLARGAKMFFLPHYSRWRLWFALFAVSCLYLNAYGLGSVIGLYLLEKPLQWDLSLIGIYLALLQAFHGIALLFVLPVLIALRLPGGLIALIGVLLSGSAYFLTGFVKTTWQIFAISVLQGLEAIMGPPLRGAMSKAVAVEDQGPLFSVIAAVQVFIATFASVIFSFFYPFSLRVGWQTGSVFFLMAAIALVPMPFILVLFIFRNGQAAVHRQEPKPDPDDEEEDERDDEHDLLSTTETQALLEDLPSSQESSFKKSSETGENYGSIN